MWETERPRLQLVTSAQWHVWETRGPDYSWSHQLNDMCGRQEAQTTVGHISSMTCVGDREAQTTVGHIISMTCVGDREAQTTVGHIISMTCVGDREAQTTVGHIISMTCVGDKRPRLQLVTSAQ